MEYRWRVIEMTTYKGLREQIAHLKDRLRELESAEAGLRKIFTTVTTDLHSIIELAKIKVRDLIKNVKYEIDRLENTSW